MELRKVLKEFETNSKEFCFNQKKYKYTEAVYKYKDIQCIKYFILDFTDETKFREIVWEDQQVFQTFQTLLLENEFFHSYGDTRYNLYLIFIVNQGDELLDNIYIQQDFLYARKIILTVSEASIFFDWVSLKRENSMSDTSNSKQIMRELSLRKTDAKKMFQRVLTYWYDMNKRSGDKFDILVNDVMPIFQLLNELEKRLPQIQRDKKKIYTQRKYNSDDGIVQQITDITIKDFRKYQGEYYIPFKKVNLICGENGMGKTSLLEAIELGITGSNRIYSRTRKIEGDIEVKCLTDQNETCVFSAKKNNYYLAKMWYGMDVVDSESFNRFFTQYNYFDTSWASVFAIEGEERVNINQLKEFLNIDDMERCKVLLHELFEKLLEVALKNDEKIKIVKKKEKGRIRRAGNFLKRSKGKGIVYSLEEIEKYNNLAIMSFKDQVKRLEETEIITLDNILTTHISKMKRIFKLLICSNEYSDLQLDVKEIVALRCIDKVNCQEEKISMSQMSTGQKVSLALAFMFSLFLSNENAPNIILLDEPVANLDDLHMLNLIDVLRRFAMAGTQIFFTTSNSNVAKLFRRKFSYLGEDFGVYRVSEYDDKAKVIYEKYDWNKEEPVVTEAL